MARMGAFASVELENPHSAGVRRSVSSVVVDSGAALSWFPATMLAALHVKRMKRRQFRRSDGSIITRWTGEALIHVMGRVTIDEVVFGGDGDPIVLGARSLTGLNLTVDPSSMRLVDKGPAPAVAVGKAECADVVLVPTG